MDIELLKTFIEVNNSRNFTRAADQLFLTSAAVSARIRQLERLLGVELFIRKRGDLALTGDGERLLPHAETLVLNWSITVQEIGLKQQQNFRLHLGATSGLWQFYLASHLKTITESFPELAIRAEACEASDLAERLMNRTIDLAISYEPPVRPELSSEKIGQLRLAMVSSREGASITKALDSTYVYVDWGPSFSVFHAKKFGEVSPASIYVNLAGIALQHLAQADGSAYLPVGLIAGNDFLYPVRGAPEFRRPVYATYRVNYQYAEILQDIIEVLKRPGGKFNGTD